MQPFGGFVPLYWSSQPSPKSFSQSFAASDSLGWTSRGRAPVLTLGVGTARGVGPGLRVRPGTTDSLGPGGSVKSAASVAPGDGVGPAAIGPGPTGASI